MSDSLYPFRDAIRAAGLEPPEIIQPGKFYRFPGIGKYNGNTAGWCILFEDGLGGCFGDWSSDFSENWRAKPDKLFTDAEKTAFWRYVGEARKLAETERKENYAVAAKKAVEIWNTAAPASNEHPYLISKNVAANGVRQDKGSLLIPVRLGNELRSLQFITADGDKRFLRGGQVSGCYFSIGTIKGAKALCIAEGFATGASIHQATGYPVAVAFNASNLEPVAKSMCKQFSDLPLIICADNDRFTEGNPGITKASLAAKESGAKLALPVFGEQHPVGGTDFNDMAAFLSLEAVAEAINSATYINDSGVATWAVPLPLMAKIEPDPYPVDALPDTIRAAVEEVQAFTQAPIALVAASALAALSLAIQAHADVKRAEKLSGPVGLFLLTIADSGERKSTCDHIFMDAIRQYEANQAEEAKPLIRDHNAAKEAWEAKCRGLKEKIRSLAKNGKATHELERTLRNLEHEKPKPPRVPRLIYGDATPEALKWNLAKDWPSGGVVSSEAGLVFGAHGMGKDSVMRNLATLNQLWDGAAIATERRTSESFTVRGARLTVALQVQETTLRHFLDRSDGLARGTGFLARFLIAWPESTQGYRPYCDPPESWSALEKFNQRLTEILELEVPIKEDGALAPPLMSMTQDTKAAWVIYHDAIESELRSGGELFDVRDVASKTADNAARIATLFQLFEHRTSNTIGREAFEGASRIAAWYLHEARRFYGELALPEEQANAVRLDSWLIDCCRRENTNCISRREIQRNVTPGHLRKGTTLDNAVTVLEELERVRLVQKGRCREVHINPALLNGETQ